MEIGLAAVIGLIVGMIGAYVVGYQRGSRRFKRLRDEIGEDARDVLDQRSDVQFPPDATFLVEDADEYGHGDDPIREALNPFDQQFITYQERFDYPPDTPDDDKAEYQYYLIVMDAWEQFETYSFIEDWATRHDAPAGTAS